MIYNYNWLLIKFEKYTILNLLFVVNLSDCIKMAADSLLLIIMFVIYY